MVTKDIAFKDVEQPRSTSASSAQPELYIKKPDAASVDRKVAANMGLPIEKEFDALSFLYSVSPKYFVKPVELLREDGKAVGIAMEKVDGTTVYAALSEKIAEAPKSTVDRILEGLAGYSSTVIARGYVHGDLNRQNILLPTSADGQLTGEVKIIDPKVTQDTPDREAMLRKDAADIRRAMVEIMIERGMDKAERDRTLESLGMPKNQPIN